TRTTQKRSAPMIQLPPTRSLSQHMGMVGATLNYITFLRDSVYNECLGSEIFALTSKGFQGFWVSLVFSQKRAGKTSTLGGQVGRAA
uniref:Uncharacterized protein n=1 Tax=Saimiri boliviensis boliviensis TaxID=39432 RepID=A0A2K6T910_SAIBB